MEAEKKEKENEMKQLAIDLEHKNQIKRQKIITLSVVVALFLTLFLVYFIFRGFNQKKKANLILEETNKIIEEKNKDITDSITYAQRIQLAILPSFEFIKQYLPEAFVLYKPKDIVAGDFYWMEIVKSREFRDDRLENSIASSQLRLIAAADCTGHGVPGAMVSVVCSNALNRTVKEFGITDPGKILDKVRELVLETFEKSGSDVKDGMDVSLCSILPVLNSEFSTIQWAGANNPLWYIRDGVLKEITANKQPIGKTDNPKPFTTHTLQLKKNDMLFLFSDGFADQFGGPAGKKFKYKTLEKLLLENAGKPLQDQERALLNAFDDWKGHTEQVDDVLIIGIRI
jgi:serine phosphatase RsbU (regulator of sigma subunit)